MLETNAVFRRKETDIEITNAVIEKVVHLSGAEFDSFSKNLLKDWGFILDNPIERSYDAQGRCHCLLVVGEGRKDGILVNSEGGSYARYSALLPNVNEFLMANQYPALGELNKKLEEVVNNILEQASDTFLDGRKDIDLIGIENDTGIEVSSNATLRSTVIKMLEARPEIRDWELDGGTLVVWRERSDIPVSVLAEQLKDPTVTPADMYAYGYTWKGMIPLSTDWALATFDAGYEVFRLYENDAEGLITEREEIFEHDGLFGTENPAWEKSERTQPFQVFIVNTEKQSQGENVGEWLVLPADAGALQGLLERIGVENPTHDHDSFAITAVRMPIEDSLREYVSKYNNLDELNMLASFVDDMDDYYLDKPEAILTTHIADLDVYEGITAIINLLHEENFTAFDFIYAHNEDELGRWYTDAGDEVPEGVSFEEYGRSCVKSENGKFVPDLDGYVKRIHKNVLLMHEGDVPDKHKIVGDALRGLQSKAAKQALEQGSGEKPSVLDEIKASRDKPGHSQARAASRSKDWGVQKTKRDKGGYDL